MDDTRQMTITVSNLRANRVELDDFLDSIYEAGNQVNLEGIEFKNLILYKSSPATTIDALQGSLLDEVDEILNAHNLTNKQPN